MGKVLMKGNEAIGEAAIRAGCLNYFAYPITPQSEVAEYLVRRMPEVGGVFLQGESEVAVAYMIFGAAVATRINILKHQGVDLASVMVRIEPLGAAEIESHLN